jgi:ABC-type nitrate/sulfonate/bicarbonate transport system substrate-binding protein
MTLAFARRTLLGALAACSLTAAPALAQTTPIKFQLDWRFEGPGALFLVPQAKGYFKDEKLDVTVDAGNGSGGTVTRVASGAYDIIRDKVSLDAAKDKAESDFAFNTGLWIAGAAVTAAGAGLIVFSMVE